MTYLWNTSEDILKNVGNQTVLVMIDFHGKKSTDISQIICFYIPQKKVMLVF